MLDDFGNTYRKDRKQGGGGVFFVCVKSCFPSSRLDSSDWEGQSEQIWVRLPMQRTKDLAIGSFYRPPSTLVQPFSELRDMLEKGIKDKGQIVIVGGDFKCRGIEWDTQTSTQSCDHPQICEDLITLANDTGLILTQREPTRERSILDLFFTNKLGLIKTQHTIPGISDHHMIVIDSDIKPVVSKHKPKMILRYKKADWKQAKKDTTEFTAKFMENFDNYNVQQNWTFFKEDIISTITKNIPRKVLSTRSNLAWMNQTLKSRINKKNKLYYKAKKTNM